NKLMAVDCNGYAVTIQVADGTYAAGAKLFSLINCAAFTLQGNVSTPGNCVISSATGQALQFSGGPAVTVPVRRFKLSASGSGANGVTVNDSAWITFGAMEYGSCVFNHMQAFHGGEININADYTISGGARAHWNVQNGYLTTSNRTITITGTPAFSTTA